MNLNWNHNPLNGTPWTRQDRRNFVENRDIWNNAIIAYDNRGVLSTDFDPVGVTVNGTYYAAFFGDEIESSYTKEATGAPKRWCCANSQRHAK